MFQYNISCNCMNRYTSSRISVAELGLDSGDPLVWGVKSPDSEESDSRYSIERFVKTRGPTGGGDSGPSSSDTECCVDPRSMICLTRVAWNAPPYILQDVGQEWGIKKTQFALRFLLYRKNTVLQYCFEFLKQMWIENQITSISCRFDVCIRTQCRNHISHHIG